MNRLQYFYHSDHLGSSSFISDVSGYAVQHLQYLPFGETMVDLRMLSTFNSRYTFSGKEKDDETQYSYFGARYYDSDVSIWLSVDPMSDKYPSMSPFMYCAGNPVMLIDPFGLEPGDPLKKRKGKFKDKNADYVPENGAPSYSPVEINGKRTFLDKLKNATRKTAQIIKKALFTLLNFGQGTSTYEKPGGLNLYSSDGGDNENSTSESEAESIDVSYLLVGKNGAGKKDFGVGDYNIIEGTESSTELFETIIKMIYGDDMGNYSNPNLGVLIPPRKIT